MTSGKWQTAWRIYHAACQLPADQQQAFVESESADPDIARQVSDLLASLAEEEDSLSESMPGDRKLGARCQDRRSRTLQMPVADRREAGKRHDRFAMLFATFRMSFVLRPRPASGSERIRHNQIEAHILT